MDIATGLAIHSQASAMYQAHGIAAVEVLRETRYVTESASKALAKAGRNKGILIGIGISLGTVAVGAGVAAIVNHVKKKKSQEESK